jgi:hypothetical protein
MLSTVDCYVIARESNVVRVDFSRDPDPPAPCFPGANGLRLSDIARDDADVPTAIAIGTAGHDGPALPPSPSASPKKRNSEPVCNGSPLRLDMRLHAAHVFTPRDHGMVDSGCRLVANQCRHCRRSTS